MTAATWTSVLYIHIAFGNWLLIETAENLFTVVLLVAILFMIAMVYICDCHFMYVSCSFKTSYSGLPAILCTVIHSCSMCSQLSSLISCVLSCFTIMCSGCSHIFISICNNVQVLCLGNSMYLSGPT